MNLEDAVIRFGGGGDDLVVRPRLLVRPCSTTSLRIATATRRIVGWVVPVRRVWCGRSRRVLCPNRVFRRYHALRKGTNHSLCRCAQNKRGNACSRKSPHRELAPLDHGITPQEILGGIICEVGRRHL